MADYLKRWEVNIYNQLDWNLNICLVILNFFFPPNAFIDPQ